MPLSKKQKKIAAVATPRNKITGADFAKLKGKKRGTKTKSKVA
jgi:hypothetical protein|tara:strand:+ start:314 stop:442 length:129 start_codon:yes stop_codon:yes gene_type:complete